MSQEEMFPEKIKYRLIILEGVIERGLETFVDVGLALTEIRNNRLYKETHGTFEDYCRERWGWNRSYAYRQIAAAETASLLSPMGDKPESERVARPLTRLEPEQQREAWEEAVRESPDGKPTAAIVEKTVSRKMDVHYSSGRDDWETPQAFFDRLDAEFGFTLDVCATDRTAKCSEYFTPEEDGLAQAWSGVCWMNPPYGDEIPKWVEKAYTEAVNGNVPVVCLIPSRTDTAWWHDYVMKATEIRFIRGRLKFGGSKDSAPFPSAIVIFDGSGGGGELAVRGMAASG